MKRRMNLIVVIVTCLIVLISGCGQQAPSVTRKDNTVKVETKTSHQDNDKTDEGENKDVKTENKEKKDESETAGDIDDDFVVDIAEKVALKCETSYYFDAVDLFIDNRDAIMSKDENMCSVMTDPRHIVIFVNPQKDLYLVEYGEIDSNKKLSGKGYSLFRINSNNEYIYVFQSGDWVNDEPNGEWYELCYLNDGTPFSAAYGICKNGLWDGNVRIMGNTIYEDELVFDNGKMLELGKDGSDSVVTRAGRSVSWVITDETYGVALFSKYYIGVDTPMLYDGMIDLNDPNIYIITDDSLKNAYMISYSSSKELSEDDLFGLTKEQLRIARNEIYARHGRMFNDKELQDYFESKSWYRGYISPDDWNEDDLTEIEKKNIKLIADYENKLE